MQIIKLLDYVKQNVGDFSRSLFYSIFKISNGFLLPGFIRKKICDRIFRLNCLAEYEPAVQRSIRDIVQPGWVCADVGAHYGYITMLLAELVAPSGQVFAFEAFPPNARRIQQLIELKGIKSVVNVVNVAISDGMEKSIWLHPGRGLSRFEWNIVGHDIAGNPTPAVLQIPATSLDECFPSGSRLDFVKMDIEGAAAGALAGMRRLLRENKPVLLIEVHDDTEWAGCAELCAGGYELKSLDGARVEWHPGAKRLYHCLAIPSKSDEAATCRAEAKVPLGLL